MDEMLNILEHIRNYPLSGERPSSRKSVQVSPDLLRAVKETVLVLACHNWVNTRIIHKIAKQHHVDYESLLDSLDACESDNSRYIALPSKELPPAPDD